MADFTFKILLEASHSESYKTNAEVITFPFVSTLDPSPAANLIVCLLPR